MAKKELRYLFERTDEIKIQIEFVCPTTKGAAVVSPSVSDFRATGGCMGGHGPEEFCYCDSPTTELTFQCPSCGHNHMIEMGN